MKGDFERFENPIRQEYVFDPYSEYQREIDWRERIKDDSKELIKQATEHIPLVRSFILQHQALVDRMEREQDEIKSVLGRLKASE